MGLDLRLYTFADRLESDATVYVVEDRGEYQDDYQGANSQPITKLMNGRRKT